LLRCFLIPEQMSILWPGEKRENSPITPLFTLPTG